VRSDHYAETHNPRDFVERAKVAPRHSERIQRREVSGLAPCFCVEFGADPPNKFRLAAHRGKHTGKEKKIACLHRFYISAEGLRRGGEFDPEFL
jgi:hypothetical protein